MGDLMVKDIFSSPKFKPFTIIAGKNGLTNKVKDIIVLETPEGMSWLHGNKIVLTAGYAFHDKKQYKESLIEDAKKRNVAAIGIKIGRYFGEITNDLLEKADKASIPIFIIDKSTDYSSLANSFYEILFDNKAKNLIKENQAYNKLLNIQTEDTTITKIVKETSKITGLNLSYIRYPDQEDRDKKIIPISKKENLGYLMVEICDKLSTFQKNCINYSIALINNKLSIEQEAIFSQSKSYRLITKLLLGEGKIDNDFFSYVKDSLKWKSDKYYGIYFKTINNKNLRYSNVRKYIEYKTNNQFLYSKDKEGMVIFLPYEKDEIKDLLNKLKLIFNREEKTFKIGVSKINDNFKTMKTAYKAAKYLTDFYEEDIIFLEDKMEELVFLEIINLDWAGKFFAKKIEMLKDDKELLESLEKFVENNYNRQKTAQDLFIHPETLRYRLKKIKNLTNLDVNKSQDLTLITILVKFSKNYE